MADPGSPGHIGGFVEIGLKFNRDWPLVGADFRTGAGVGWHEHSAQYAEGLDLIARPLIGAYLATEWLPALDGMGERLLAGARVADVGCGYGWPTIVMAEAYPESTFRGFDYHDAAIARARKTAADRGRGRPRAVRGRHRQGLRW